MLRIILTLIVVGFGCALILMFAVVAWPLYIILAIVFRKDIAKWWRKIMQKQREWEEANPGIYRSFNSETKKWNYFDATTHERVGRKQVNQQPRNICKSQVKT